MEQTKISNRTINIIQTDTKVDVMAIANILTEKIKRDMAKKE